MARNLPGGSQNAAEQQYGSEPVNVLLIEWGIVGSIYYSDKSDSFVVGNQSGLDFGNAKPLILEISTINQIDQGFSGGEIASISATLDDSDGTFEGYLKTEVIEGTVVKLYQNWADIQIQDAFIIFQGVIADGVVWDEGARTFSFSAETLEYKGDVGFFVSNSNDIDNVHPDAFGEVWPLCYGTPIHQKAVHLRKQIVGELLDEVISTTTTFGIANGAALPQSSSIDIEIQGILFSGTMGGTTFTVTTANKPFYTNVAIATRPASDPDDDTPRVVWVNYPPDKTPTFVGKYFYINDWDANGEDGWGYMINVCYAQEGNKLFFVKPWRPANPEDLLGQMPDALLGDVGVGISSFAEISGAPRSSWGATFSFDTEFWAKKSLIGGGWVRSHFDMGDKIIADSWVIDAGEEVRVLNEYDDLYVVNEIESNTVRAVYAYREIKDTRKLVPIPEKYYEVNLSDAVGTPVNRDPTTISFEVPLRSRIGENWEADIFVTLESDVEENTSNQIEDIIERHTDLIIDGITFNDAESKLSRYPSHFAITETQSAIEVAKQVAWQARCVLAIRGEIVYIRYLSLEVDEVNATSDLRTPNTIAKTQQFAFTGIDSIKTHFTGTYSPNQLPDTQEDRVIFNYNMDEYGVRRQNWDFWIYNNKECVVWSLGFWGYRLANSWKIMQTSHFMDQIGVELYDYVSVAGVSDPNNYAHFGSPANALVGLITNVVHDSAVPSIQLTSLLPIKAGTVVKDRNFWRGDPDNEVHIINIRPDDLFTDFKKSDKVLRANLSDEEAIVGISETESGSERPIEIKKQLYNQVSTTNDPIDNYYIVDGPNPKRSYILDEGGIPVWLVEGTGDAPAYAAMEIIPKELPNDKGILEVRRPQTENLSPGRVVFNSNKILQSGQVGLAYSALERPCICQGSNFDERCGTNEDSWQLDAAHRGFISLTGKMVGGHSLVVPF